MASKYKWRATPEAVRNIVIALAVVIVVVVLIVSGIKKGVNNAKARRAYKQAAKELEVKREEYAAQGVSFPSGYTVSALTTPLPTSIRDYVVVYQNQAKLPTGAKKQAQHNAGMTHYLYQLVTGDREQIKNIKFTDAELAAKFPTFYQWDERWGFTEYGDSQLGLNGSGPTVASMLIVGLTKDQTATPRALARYAESEGLYYEDYGTAWSLITYSADEYGLDSFEIWLDEDAIKNALDAGYGVALVMSEGHFCQDSCFILLTGYNDQGFTVVDPNSIENTNTVWSYADIKGEIMAIYAVGGGSEETSDEE